MKFYFLGTCAGTKPIEGWHHQAFAIETGGVVYWFDAGECSAYTAHIMGLDLLKVKSVFISHTHFDHVGGLANLFWNMKKLSRKGREKIYEKINLFIPNIETWKGLEIFLDSTDKESFSKSIKVEPFEVSEGVIFSDENITVEAIHTEHLGKPEDGVWRAFGYKINCEGKTVIYTGDIGLANLDDLNRIVSDCDVLLVETGHHPYTEVLEALEGKNIGMVAFTHHGGDIRNNPLEACYNAQAKYNRKTIICTDGTTLTI